MITLLLYLEHQNLLCCGLDCTSGSKMQRYLRFIHLGFRNSLITPHGSAKEQPTPPAPLPSPQLERPMQSNKDPAQPINGKKNCSAGWCGPAWGSRRKASARGRGVVRSRAVSTASPGSAPLMTNFSGTWSPQPFTYSKRPSRQNSLKSKSVSHFLQGFGTLSLNM